MCSCDEGKKRMRENSASNAALRTSALNLVRRPTLPNLPNIPSTSYLTPSQRAVVDDVGQRYRDAQFADSLGLPETEKKSKVLPIALGVVGVGALAFFLTR